MEEFFDLNVFLYHLADEKPEATKLLHKVESREIRAETYNVAFVALKYFC